MTLKGSARVDITRRAVLFDNVGDRNVFRVKFAIALIEIIHETCLLVMLRGKANGSGDG